MSFLKIKDPRERERVVKEFLEIKKNIRANELAEKMGKIEFREGLSEIFKPVTEAQKTTAREITEGLRPIKEGIEQLPQRIPREKPIIIPSTSREKIGELFPGSDTVFGIYEKGGEYFIGDKILTEIKVDDGNVYYNIGKPPKKWTYLKTPGLEYLLTSKKIDEIEDVPASDISTYVKIVENTNAMYLGNDPTKDDLKPVNDPDLLDKFSLIVQPAWEKMLKKGKKKGKGKKTGKGLKKVVVPCDPNALLERLDLLMASKAAGHTGLRNELVSVCDELKRQGIFDNKGYKRIMSLL